MLEKSCQWWLILFFCHGGAEGQLQWFVKEKVTAYGQNLILFCPVENCCSEPAGWSVGIKSIIIDVKLFSNDPKVKYHGTYTKDGFGVVIRNLSEADLNVTYRCAYGFDQSTPKYLLHGDVFREIQLQWVVKEKVTAYGQNLILFCPVENCCSEPAGWSVGIKSIIIDVKLFSNDPKVKYHGTYNKDGFGVVIRNLSEADLNVTYRCAYGFDQSTPKYLLHGDVFRENVPDKEKENDTTATIMYEGMRKNIEIVVPIVVIMVLVGIGIVAYCVYRSRIKKKRQKQTGTDVEKHLLNDSGNQQGIYQEKIPLNKIENQKDNQVQGKTINQDRTNQARLSNVVFDIFPNILRKIMHFNIKPEALHQHIRKQHKTNPSILEKMTPKELESVNTLSKGTYDDIDFTTLYKLMQSLSLLGEPTQGWGELPTNADVAIIDEVERLCIMRYNIVQYSKADIVKVTERIDIYLEKLPDQGFTREVLICMDP